jgi:indole-3-glycerol phosphate synthase
LAQKSLLSEIVEARRREVEESRAVVPIELLRERAGGHTERRDFAQAISEPGLSVIAEIKKASPSRGVIRQDYRPMEIARAYELAGAAALSVLTEEQYFQGSLDHLSAAREASRLPVLRKDFIVDEYQVYESAAAGADALLLIVAALDDRKLGTLLELAQRLNIASLVEVHTEKELDRALAAEARMIGVNNRDLATLNVDLESSFRLRERIQPGLLAVSESGIKTPEHLQRLGRAGFDAVLIGEHLLLAEDPGKELARLRDAAGSVKVH